MNVDMEDGYDEGYEEEEEEISVDHSFSDPYGNTDWMLSELVENSSRMLSIMREMRNDMGGMQDQLELLTTRVSNLEVALDAQPQDINDLIRELRGARP